MHETTTSVNVGSGVDTALGDPISTPKPNKNYFANAIKQCPRCKCKLSGDDTLRLKTFSRCVCSKCKFMINREKHDKQL